MGAASSGKPTGGRGDLARSGPIPVRFANRTRRVVDGYFYKDDETDPAQQVASDGGSSTTITFEDADGQYNRGGAAGISVAAGIFTCGAAVAGRILIVNVSVALIDVTGDEGFESLNGRVKFRIHCDGVGPKSEVSRQGLEPAALTTDSTNPGGGHAHTHTVAAHTHGDYTGGGNDDLYMHTSGSWLMAEGDTFRFSVRQTNSGGHACAVAVADISFVVV